LVGVATILQGKFFHLFVGFNCLAKITKNNVKCRMCGWVIA
jgi:hypothetical protein